MLILLSCLASSLQSVPSSFGLMGGDSMSESKYAAQQKYNRKNYVRFPLDLKPDVLDTYKKACAKNNTTPTTEIKRFIEEYCEKYG